MYGSKQGWSLSTYPGNTCSSKDSYSIKKYILSVNVFSSKVLIGDTIIYVCYWRRDRHFARSCEPLEGLPVCRAKEVPSFLSYFKTQSIGPAPGIGPATFLSAVERSADLANPAAKFWFVHKMLMHATTTPTASKTSLNKKHRALCQTLSLLIHHAKFVKC